MIIYYKIILHEVKLVYIRICGLQLLSFPETVTNNIYILHNINIAFRVYNKKTAFNYVIFYILLYGNDYNNNNDKRTFLRLKIS